MTGAGQSSFKSYEVFQKVGRQQGVSRGNDFRGPEKKPPLKYRRERFRGGHNQNTNTANRKGGEKKKYHNISQYARPSLQRRKDSIMPARAGLRVKRIFFTKRGYPREKKRKQRYITPQEWTERSSPRELKRIWGHKETREKRKKNLGKQGKISFVKLLTKGGGEGLSGGPFSIFRGDRKSTGWVV